MVLALCSEHLGWLKKKNPLKKEKWLQDEHYKIFVSWLKKKGNP